MYICIQCRAWDGTDLVRGTNRWKHCTGQRIHAFWMGCRIRTPWDWEDVRLNLTRLLCPVVDQSPRYGEMTIAEKEKISHRGRALEKLKAYFNNRIDNP